MPTRCHARRKDRRFTRKPGQAAGAYLTGKDRRIWLCRDRHCASGCPVQGHGIADGVSETRGQASRGEFPVKNLGWRVSKASKNTVGENSWRSALDGGRAILYTGYIFTRGPTMTIARRELIDVSVTRWYHCISECVRGALLLGKGELNRKEWLENASKSSRKCSRWAWAGIRC